MKIRSGFVSNSSSSSFVLFGNIFSANQIRNYLKSLGVTVEHNVTNCAGCKKEIGPDVNFCPSCGRKVPSRTVSNYDLEGLLNDTLKKNGITNMTVRYMEGDVAVGRYPFSIADDETGKQFRDSVNKVIQMIDPSEKAHAMDEVIGG